MSGEDEELELVTVRFSGEDEKLLEEVDRLVEEGAYSNRSEALRDSVDRLLSGTETDRELVYDAAVTSYTRALDEEKYSIARNAKQFLMSEFADKKLGRYLEQRHRENMQ